MKLKLVVLGMITTLFVLLMPETTHAASKFKDVKDTHWAKEAIEWGVVNGVITGYSDSTFKPNKNVTEAEFVAMLLRSYNEYEASEKGEHWAEKSYKNVALKNYPVLGDEDKDYRSLAIDRLTVAEMIVGANGYHFDGAEAIHYLIGNDLSNGKTSKTIEGYHGLSDLTRAEAITFIKNLKDKGMAELKDRPVEKSAINLLPKLDDVYIIGNDHLNLDYAHENEYAMNTYRLSNGSTNVKWSFDSDNVVENEEYINRMIELNATTPFFWGTDMNENTGVFRVGGDQPIGYGTIRAKDATTGETIAEKRILISYNNIKNLVISNGLIEVHLIKNELQTIHDERWGTYEVSWNRDGLELYAYSEKRIKVLERKLDRTTNIIYFTFDPFDKKDQTQYIHVELGYMQSTAVSQITIIVPGKK